MEPLHISPGEMTATEILEELESGRRVVIEIEKMGLSTTVVARKSGDTYYCDTPIKLLTYETETEMKQCLERYRLAETG